MFSRLLDKISSNKRNILWIIVWFLLFFVLSDSVFADDVTNTSNFEKARQTAASAAEWIWTILTVFLSVLTYLSTVFLSPEWINGSLFGLNWYFKSIWILISNVVYLIFAFIIIWIAFMNIIWKWQEKYALKQALPKFVVGVLIVPFSWFLVQFILSISAVLTISALNLPFETFKTFDNKLSEVKIPTKCTLNLKSEDPNKTWTNWKEETKKFFDCWGKDAKKISLSELRSSEKGIDSIFWVIWIYTYGILSIESMDNLNASEINKITNMLDLIVKLVFDVLFIVVYSILMIALWLVLMVRWIYIWIYVMISPVFWLMYFFDKTSGWWEFFDKFNLKQFISLVMVPVYTMLALSFWLLFIYAAWHGMSYNSPYKDVSTVILSKPNKAWDQDLKIGQFSLAIKWSPANSKNITWFFGKISDEWLGVIWTLILKIFGIVVLWWAVMAALRSNEMTKAIVEPLHAFGAQVWWLVTKAPQYAPIFGGQSMKSMQTIWWSVESYVNQKALNSAWEFTKKHMPFMDNWWVTRNLEAEKSYQRIKALTSTWPDMILKSEYKKLLQLYSDNPDAMRTDPWFKKSVEELAKKLSIETNDFDYKSLDSISKTVVWKIEEKFDSTPNVGWLTSEVNVSSNLWQNWLKELVTWLKDNWTPDAWNNPQIINLNISQYHDNNMPKIGELNWQTIAFNKDWKITDWYIDNMWRAINWLSEIKFKELMSARNIVPDNIIKQLGNSYIIENWIIKIDLSKIWNT